ncbi:MAG: hypothetical protein LW720_10610 [Pirellula sp.]|nr:hypothetical protein [Pirellula sp.]
MKSRIIAIFSVFSEIKNIDFLNEDIQTLSPTSSSFDRNPTVYSSELGVVQAYFHIECDHISETIASLREKFAEKKIALTSSVSQDSFLAFAEYWFCNPKTILPSDLSKSNDDPKIKKTSLTRDYGHGNIGQVFFIERSSLEPESNHSITLIEVPHATETNFALELAHHKEHALRCTLCIIDLLSAKVTWLGRNLFGDSTNHPDRLLEQFEKNIEKKPENRQMNNTNASSKTQILFPFTEVSTCLSTLQMTRGMLGTIKRQVSILTKIRINAISSLAELEETPNPYFYNIEHCISEVESLERSVNKYSEILQGVKDYYQTRNLHKLAALEEVKERKTELSQSRFNFLTLLLGVIAVALATTTLLDNESTKSLLYYWKRDDWEKGLSSWQVSQKVLKYKSIAVVTVTLLAILISCLMFKWQKPKKHEAR